QIPQVWTRTRISPAPISGTGTSSMRTSSTPRYTAALIIEGTAEAISRLSPSTINVDVRSIAIADFIISLNASIRPAAAQPAKSYHSDSRDLGNSRALHKEPG